MEYSRQVFAPIWGQSTPALVVGPDVETLPVPDVGFGVVRPYKSSAATRHTLRAMNDLGFDQ